MRGVVWWLCARADTCRPQGGPRPRLPRLRAALPAPRQHHVAARGWRQQHRDEQDRGPRDTAITEEYTLVGLNRQDDLTRLIQGKRAKAANASDTSKPPISTLLAAQRRRARNTREAIKDRKIKVFEIGKQEIA